jgi:hypothetical protein
MRRYAKPFIIVVIWITKRLDAPSAGRNSASSHAPRWLGAENSKQRPCPVHGAGTPSAVRSLPAIREKRLETLDEVRENARACLQLARKADSDEARGHWVAMAQYWYDLAEDAEERPYRRSRK